MIGNDSGCKKEVSEFLNELGIHSHWADSLREAASIDDQYDVILMDVNQPDACSVGVVKFFIETARSPVIVITENPEVLNGCRGELPENVVAVNRDHVGRQLAEALIAVLTLQLEST